VRHACSLLLLRHGQGQSLNIRGAFLEVLSDFLGAAAVIAAAVVIAVTGFQRADPIASLLIGAMIIPRTWQLLRQATDVLLEATPKNVNLDEVRRHMLETPGVIDVHDLHAWTITSGVNVLSAHVVVTGEAASGPVLDQLGGCLADHSTSSTPPSRSNHPATVTTSRSSTGKDRTRSPDPTGSPPVSIPTDQPIRLWRRCIPAGIRNMQRHDVAALDQAAASPLSSSLRRARTGFPPRPTTRRCRAR
jgi:Cation efflux family